MGIQLHPVLQLFIKLTQTLSCGQRSGASTASAAKGPLRIAGSRSDHTLTSQNVTQTDETSTPQLTSLIATVTTAFKTSTRFVVKSLQKDLQVYTPF